MSVPAWLTPALLALGGLIWLSVKLHAISVDNPYRWDWASWIAGGSTALVTLLVYSPSGVSYAGFAALCMFASVWFGTLFSGLMIEEETDYMEPPDDLAPISQRVRGTQTIKSARSRDGAEVGADNSKEQ